MTTQGQPYYRYDEEFSGVSKTTGEVQLHRDIGINEPRRPKNGSLNSPTSDQRFGQPLPSPLQENKPFRQPPAKQQSMSSSSSSQEDLHRSVAVTVVKDSGTKVELMLKAHGLKKKKGFLSNLITTFKKPHQPSRLLANGRFTNFALTENSLQFVLVINTEKKKKKGNGNRQDTFSCHIRQFPCEINPDSAEFEVLEPASGEAFILLTLMKLATNVNWKEFLDTHGTLDAKEI
ncbi:unnamed protein product [Caenorhabditis auriculariae]|uniref:Uncharacterized protein n=1 Tax=Caenorhabditis auriculariae TaxID=2777116 RepID=A0A8S1HRQ1_9PELO|nr:unnamed protein product [Caenorhabditis auriculariae]